MGLALPREVVRARELVEHVSLAAFGAWWIGPMTHATGGRGPSATLIALALLVPLLISTRFWRRVGIWTLLLPVAVPLGALTACVLSPAGWSGADDLAGYTLAALSVPAVLAYARTAARQQAVIVVVVLAGMVQFAMGFLAWWGGGDPSHPMVGTFFWWNPYAAFLLAPALLGAALALRGERPWRLLGAFAVPLCSTGILLSSSRAVLTCLVLGLVAVGVSSVLSVRGRRACARMALGWLLIVASIAGTATLLTGPPFFPSRAAVTGAADARAAQGQSVATNGGYRLQFWERAVAVVQDRPIFGSGAHELAEASDPLVATSVARSNYAHNGYLQAASDGGIVLGGPFLLAALLAGVALLRRLAAGLRGRGEWRQVVLPVAALALMVHGGVDFDWTYPSQFLMTAVILALALSVRIPRADEREGGRWRPVAAVLALLLIAVSGTAVHTWQFSRTGVAAVAGSPTEVAQQLHALGQRRFADDRSALELLDRSAGRQGPIPALVMPRRDVRWAVERTAAAAQVDSARALVRARALVQLGERGAASGAARAVLERSRPAAGSVLLLQVADVLAATGQGSQAARYYVDALLDSRQPERRPLVLLALLSTPGYSTGAIAQCAAALVAQPLPGTPDPGPLAPGTPCLLLLKGQAS
jgi:O-antigen ligase